MSMMFKTLLKTIILFHLMIILGTGVAFSGGSITDSWPAMDTSKIIKNNKAEINMGAGSSSYSYPISVPPGRKGLTPSVSLNYNSQNGNGLIGIGWNLSGLPVISRTGKTIVQDGVKSGVNFDSNDKFSYNGQRLIAVSGEYGDSNTEYRTEVNGFSRIFSYNTAGSGPASFTVQSTSGNIMEFGITDDSRIEASGKSDVRIWAVNKITDPNGNTITFAYNDDQGTGEHYISRIDYTGNTNIETPYYSIRFEYDDRPDNLLRYFSGSMIQTRKRLLTIDILINDSEQTIKQYYFNYKQTDNNGNAIKTSILESIELCGYDEQGNKECMPETSFTWYEKDNIKYNSSAHYYTEQFTEEYIYENGSDHKSIRNSKAEPSPVLYGDYNGDGLLDYIAHDKVGNRKLKLQNSNGEFVESTSFSNLQNINNSLWNFVTEFNQDVIRYNHHVADFNGDGISDILFRHNRYIDEKYTKSNGEDGYKYNDDTEGSIYILYSNKETGNFYPISPMIARYPALIHGPFGIPKDGHPHLKTNDFNGDGKSDILLIGTNDTRILFSDSNGGFDTKVISYENGIGEIWENREHITYIGDFNGDGITEILLKGNDTYIISSKSSNEIYYKHLSSVYGKGYWKYCNPIIGDYNGDGLSDILLQDEDNNDHSRLMISKGDGNFHMESLSQDLQNALDGRLGVVSSGDLNGDGCSDVFIKGKDNYASYIMFGSKSGQLVDLQEIADSYSYYDTDFYNITKASWRYGGVFMMDSNNDGIADFIYDIATQGTKGIVKSINEPNNILKSVESLNTKETFLYKPLTDSTVYAKDNDAVYPVKDIIKHQYIVSKIESDDGFSNLYKQSFLYEALKIDQSGRGSLGFRKVTVTESPTGNISETNYNQSFPLIGAINYTETRLSDNTVFNTQTNTYTKDDLFGDGSVESCQMIKQKESSIYSFETDVVQAEGIHTFSKSISNYDFGRIISKETGGTDTPTVIEKLRYENVGEWNYQVTRKTLNNVNGTTLQETNYTYTSDDRGNLYTQKVWNDAGDSPVTTFTEYDDYGNLTEMTDPNGNPTQFEYDDLAHTYLVKTISPTTGDFEHVSEITEIDYRFGSPKVVKNQNGFLTSNTYDSFGRVLDITYPDGGFVSYEYSDHANPRNIKLYRKEKNSGGSTLLQGVVYLDGYGRTIQSTGLGKPSDEEPGQYITTLTEYNELGNVQNILGPYYSGSFNFEKSKYENIAASFPENKWMQYIYDKRSRVKDVIHSGGITSKISYQGLKTITTDPDIKNKTTITDAFGKILQVTDHDGFSVYYTYNIPGQLTFVRRNQADTGLIENEIRYNSLGQKTYMNDPDMGVWSYIYDLNGNLFEQTDALGQTTKFNYDELNRITKKEFLNSDDPDITFSYDAGVNGIGLLNEEVSLESVKTFKTFDQLGRVKLMEHNINGASGIITKEFSYDITGKPEFVKYTQDTQPFQEVHYTYHDGTDLVKAVQSAIDGDVVYATIDEYTPFGNIDSMIYQNGVETDYIYDNTTGRINMIYAARTDGPTLVDKTYTYTPAGDITSIHNNKEMVEYTYKYDNLHRLLNETTSDTALPTGVEVVKYIYDENQPVHAPVMVSKNLQNYQSVKYNENGNLSDGHEKTVTYNPENMPIEVQAQNGSTSFGYGADGTRVSKVYGGDATYYFGSDLEEINGQLNLYIFAGNLRVAKVTGDGVTYYHKDHLGSTNATTDEIGSLFDRGEYLPFGEDKSGGLSGGYKFTDQEEDTSTGLYNYDARLYDPMLGQFVMADTLLPNIYDPQQLNRYAYVRNNPLIYTDPSGHASCNIPEGGKWYDFEVSFSDTTTVYMGTTSRNVENMVRSIFEPISNATEKLVETIVDNTPVTYGVIRELGANSGALPAAKLVKIGAASKIIKVLKKLPKPLRNKMKRINNQVAAGGNRGVSGNVTDSNAMKLGENFVGPNHRKMSNGKGLVSEDGLRTFRFPSKKKGINPDTGEPWSKTGRVVNFETKAAKGEKPISNVHLDVK